MRYSTWSLTRARVPGRARCPSVAIALLLTSLLSGCGDDEMGPEQEPTASLTLAVILPQGGAGLVPVASVDLTLVSAPGGRTAVDTVIQVTSQKDTIEVALSVRLSAESESFAAAVDCRSAGGDIVFSGQLGTVTLTSSATTQTANVPVSYVGTGATAQQVEITTTDSIVASGDTLAFDAVARDGAGNPIPGTPIRWKTSNPARAAFVSNVPAKLVGGAMRGQVSVVAELFTGPADTASVLVVPAVPSLLGEAIDSLEAALFTAVTELVDPGPFEVSKLDLFSFAPAAQLFAQVLAVDPASQTAAFGLAVSTLLSLEDDPGLRAAADGWDVWLQSNSSLRDLTTGMGGFPPTLAEQQDLLRNAVRPTLITVLDHLSLVDSADFSFTVTERMQGKSPGTVGARELDLTDVIAGRGGLKAAVAGIDIALAFQTTPSPYGPSGFDAALGMGSTFGSLAADGSTRLADARTRLLEAVAAAGDALDSLQAETDDQTDDVVKYDPMAAAGYDDLDDFLGPSDVQTARDFLMDAENTLQGATTLSMTSGLGEVLGDFLKTNIVVDGSQFFLNPASDLKTLLPEYQTSNGEFHWTALAFDEWLIPDPTLNGVLPNVTSSAELKDAIDLSGAYNEANFDIDRWAYMTQSPNDGDVFAITELGNVHEVSADMTTGTDRPDVPPGTSGFGAMIANVATSELVVLTVFDGLLYTRPDDAASGWTQRLSIGCCWVALTQSPVAASMFVVAEGDGSLEIAPDFSSTTPRPFVRLSAPTLIGNSASGELIVLSYDGTVYSRPADATTPWTQRLMLPFTGFDQYVAITEAPTGGDMLAVTHRGDLYEIASDFSSSVQRPSVPATEVTFLIGNTQTGELLALTPDGRVFSRPDDVSTPWTLRFTFPRTILP